MTIAPSYHFLDLTPQDVFEPLHSNEGRNWLGEIEASRREFLAESATRSVMFGALQDAADEAAFDGWNGEGSIAISNRAFKIAEVLIEELPQDAPIGEVGVSSRGDVVLEWGVGFTTRVTVRISRDGRLSFASVTSKNRVAYGTLDFQDFQQEILPRLSRISRLSTRDAR